MLVSERVFKEEMVLISDPIILQVPIQECEEKLMDLRNYHPRIEISSRYAANNPHHSKVRESVASMLAKVADHLPKGMKLLLYEGYRPLEVQRTLYDSYWNKLKHDNPHWSQQKLSVEVTRYVAPPDIVTPHSTGGAIDITLVNQEGIPLDMETDPEDKPDENEYRNYTLADNISDKAKENRHLLITALQPAGFINYPTEWWHWSYGDRYWAYQRKAPFAFYGSAEITIE